MLFSGEIKPLSVAIFVSGCKNVSVQRTIGYCIILRKQMKGPLPPKTQRQRLNLLPILLVWLGLISTMPAQSVFINELHYDNNSSDTNEGVEIAGPAGTNLSDYQLAFYNGTSYSTAAILSSKGIIGLSGTLTDLGAGFGVKWFAIAGIENGSNDGVALYRISTNQVIQFLSWEGTITASVSVATGLTSTDIGKSETGTTPQGHSLQLIGTGTTYTDFTWDNSKTSTPNAINTGQVLGGVVYTMDLTSSIGTIDESAGSSAATATLTLNPPPSTALTITLTSSDTTEATVQTSVVVPTSGTVTFPIAAVVDGVVDGNQPVTITAVDGGNLYPSNAMTITVRDVNAPLNLNGTLRVACYNVLLGVNSPSSAEYLAVKDALQRVNAQVIAFSEVNAGTDNNFADIKTLLQELGFPTTSQYFATIGDGFMTFESGDFGTGNTQVVCVASKFPITQTVQIGRGMAGRVEMARYPLFVSVDVPGVATADDPAFVAVHLKANSGLNGSTDADRFRRSVEAYRIAQFLQTNGWNGNTTNLVILGDFNEMDTGPQPVSYFTGINTANPGFADNSTLPGSYRLGADIAGANGITLAYDRFPHSAFVGTHVTALDVRQADNTNRGTFNLSETKLDYIFAPSPIVASGLYQGEVYNSRLEAAFDGIPKIDFPVPGALPAGNASFIASDHYLVFADVALGSMPKISVTPAVTSVIEGESSIVHCTVALSQPPGVPLDVSLNAYRPGRIRIPTTQFTFAADQTSAVVPVEILRPLAADPHRTVTISAQAAGWFPGKGVFEIRNQEAGGQLVISQYIEAATGAGSKSIELLNQAGATIEFQHTPLIVRRFSNGDTEGENEAKITLGTLDAGQVLVIGDTNMGDYLLAQGLIQPHAEFTPSTAPHGTPFYDALGRMRFWKDSFTYNGNDALEILLNYTRMDVLGTIGQDLGTEWTENTVSTADQNIELKSNVGTGTRGFTDPSLRFETVSTMDANTGFGVPPTIVDPYLLWATSTSLVGLDRALEVDPDGDAITNLMEYTLNSLPLVPNPQPLTITALTPTTARVEVTVRIPQPGEVLQYSLQQSADLTFWTPSVQPVTLNPNGGMQTLRFDVSSLTPGRNFFRFQVTRP